MDSIVKQLNTPEWWFTAVFVGVIVGIVSAYTKDWITSVLSPFSSKYRKYAEAQAAAIKTEIELLSTNREMLVIEYIRTGFRFFKVISALAASVIFPAWSVLQKKFPEVDPLTSLFGWPPVTFGLPIQSDLLPPLLSLLILAYGLIKWGEFLNRYALCEKARAKILLDKNVKQQGT